MNKTIHNVETNEITIVPLNAKELLELEERQLKSQKMAEEIALKQAESAAKKSAAEAKLAALGLTPDDLKALGL